MAENVEYHPRPAPIYPGIYQPCPGKEQELKAKGIRILKPPVNVIELSDCYLIEMPAPGFKKEEFIIRTKGCSLSISAKKKLSNEIKEARYHSREYNYDCLKRNIDLPADVDTDFGTAEYKYGILYIYLYKSSCPVKNRQSRIVVY